MKVYIVTDTIQDKDFLRDIFSRRYDLENLVFVEGGSRSCSVSLARSLLARRHEPLILALNANAVHTQVISDMEGDYRASLKQVANPLLWQVVLFRPTINISFFQNPEIPEILFNRPLTTQEEELAELAPDRVLDRLMREVEYESRYQLMQHCGNGRVIDLIMGTQYLEQMTAFVTERPKQLKLCM